MGHKYVEQPESSWSENTTPTSDELIDKEVEEIPRYLHFSIMRSGSIASNRSSPSSLIIKTRSDLYHAVGVTKSQQPYTFALTNSRASGMEASITSPSSATTTVTSATSTRTNPWNSPEYVEGAGDEWSKRNEHLLLVPKQEPTEDEVDMAHMKEQPDANAKPLRERVIAVKRPRGRPRKHPIISPEEKAKIAKARSKTGCITCRKRKKKCDERKPGCLNCEKNAVTCEGFPSKNIWKSGREKAEEAQRRRPSCPSIFEIPKQAPLLICIDTTGDKIFLDYYMNILSSKFTVEGEHVKNAFSGMLFDMATQHAGLMHSILALSSTHIDFESPIGLQYLKDYPDFNVVTAKERSDYHTEEASKELFKGGPLSPEQQAQLIFAVLQTFTYENPDGEHRTILKAYEDFHKKCPLEDGPFKSFVNEFFQYHVGLDELLCLPGTSANSKRASVEHEWELPTAAALVPRESIRLLGVFDGLFYHMARITHLRNDIREMIRNGAQTPFDYNSVMSPASNIYLELEKWEGPSLSTGGSRNLAGHLYKQMLHVYLLRTVYPPAPPEWHIDETLISYVDVGIEMLERFDTNDKSQTLLLAPAFLLGCAAFMMEQRQAIRKAIKTIKSWMGYRNTDSAQRVLDEVWRLMDNKDPESWDWQSIAERMGLDFLAT